MISSHNSYTGSSSASKAMENPALSSLTPASSPVRMPRMQIPFHSQWGSQYYCIPTLSEQSLPWHLSGERNSPTMAGTMSELSRKQLVQPLWNSEGAWIQSSAILQGKKKWEGVTRSLDLPADSAAQLISSVLCWAGTVQPFQRNPVPFIGSHFSNQCKNITQSLLIIPGLLMCSHSAITVAQITQHLVSVCDKNKWLNNWKSN